MPASYFFVKGQKAELRCSALGLPTPNVLWTRLGVQLIEGYRFAVLSLNNVTKADQGIYRCTASNSQGQKSAKMKLTVVGRWSKSFKTLVCKETVVPRRWGRETLKFGGKELMIEFTEYEAYLCIASFSLVFVPTKGWRMNVFLSLVIRPLLSLRLIYNLRGSNSLLGSSRKRAN